MAQRPEHETWQTKRARLGAHARNHPNTSVPDDLIRDLNACRAEEWARKIAAQAPPLTAEQRTRIAVIVLGANAPGSHKADA